MNFFIFRHLAETATDIKKNWNDLVAAKQAERDQEKLNLADIESDLSSSDDSDKQHVQQHLIPQVIVTDTDEEKKEEVKVEEERKFEQNSKETYAELSKALAKRLQQQRTPADTPKQVVSLETTERQNWRNKEIKTKPKVSSTNQISKEIRTTSSTTTTSVKAKVEGGQAISNEEDQVMSFSKTYSFRNLPQGRVAKIQQKFEQSKELNPSKGERVNSSPLPHIGRIKQPKKTPSRPALDIILQSQKKSLASIKAWDEIQRAQPTVLHENTTAEDFGDMLQKPRSRQGFHSSTPTLMQPMGRSLQRGVSLVSDEVQNQSKTFDPSQVKDYLDALKERRETARQRASESQYVKQHTRPPYRRSEGHWKERYFAFENVDLYGRVTSWTEVISVHSVYDVSVSDPVFV
jgi:hypothetical protein